VHVRAQPGPDVRLDNAQNLGLFVRAERQRQSLTQTQLCAAAGVSRRWLADLEAGKPTVEIGLVFRVMHALGRVLLAANVELGPDGIDLDEVLRDYEHPARTDEARMGDDPRPS
jgi:y4mF family transcriptional regulator